MGNVIVDIFNYNRIIGDRIADLTKYVETHGNTCICRLCGFTYENSRDGENEHAIYHKLIMNFKIHDGIFLTLRECRNTIDIAMETLKDPKSDDFTVKEAIRKVVLAAYSRHVINCLLIGSKLSCSNKESYERDWAMCNIHLFPKSQWEWITEYYGGSKNNWVTLEACGNVLEYDRAVDESTLDDYDDPVDTGISDDDMDIIATKLSTDIKDTESEDAAELNLFGALNDLVKEKENIKV